MAEIKLKEKLLIIGSAGLIGSAIARSIKLDINDKYKVLAPSSTELDILDKNKVQAYFETHNPDYIILAAGVVGGIQVNKTYPADFITKNLIMQLNVFLSANACKVKRVLFFASSCMYPKECEQPMRESYLHTGLLEQTSMPYAISKLAGVEMARAFNKQYNTNRFIVIIPNSVYGINDNFDPDKGHVLSALISKFHKAKSTHQKTVELWGTGEPKREFIYSDDLARAVIFLIEKSEQKELDMPINIGVGYDISIKELAYKISHKIGFDGNIKWDASKPNGAMRKLLDNSKITQMGWQPKINLDTGIDIVYDWYLDKNKKNINNNIKHNDEIIF